MCGIVGYIGKNNAKDIIIDGLKRLEYRGYDSAGIAVIRDGRLEVKKHVGGIENLETLIGDDNICLLYTSPSPRDRQKSRMPSSA